MDNTTASFNQTMKLTATAISLGEAFLIASFHSLRLTFVPVAVAYLFLLRRKGAPNMLGRLFQKKMVDQDQFTSAPYVAVWVGHHTAEEQLDDYLFSGRFSDQFRFRIEDHRLPESCVEPTPKPLGELVHGFSRYQKFQDEFLQKASALGITSATSMMVFYFMVYSPDGLPVARKPAMTFVGNFWFEGFE